MTLEVLFVYFTIAFVIALGGGLATYLVKSLDKEQTVITRTLDERFVRRYADGKVEGYSRHKEQTLVEQSDGSYLTIEEPVQEWLIDEIPELPKLDDK